MNHRDQFIEGLLSEDLDLIKSIPKTDLHCHANLSVSRKAIGDWANRSIPDPPEVYPTFSDFIQYIKNHIHPLTDHQQGLIFCITQALHEAAEDGVTHMEMSIDLKYVGFFDSISAFISCVETIKKELAPRIQFLPEIGIKRTSDIRQIEALVVELIDSGTFKSIDLYDDELAGRVEDFAEIYQYAHEKSLKLKAHTGEYHTAQSMLNCIEILNLDAIQHGINAVQDAAVMKSLAEMQIPLHICPTSNVALSRTPSIEEHPIRQLFDQDVYVTINSDDITVFSQTVSEEYLNLYKSGVFNPQELDMIRKNGLNSIL